MFENQKGDFFMKFTKEQKLALTREHVDDHVPLYQLYEKYGIASRYAKYFKCSKMVVLYQL